jgi:TonB-dependent SusC/RagA subfamily outer membrane receptor
MVRSLAFPYLPLFVVINITPFAAPVSDINPNDIESVQVLKDGSATAIYGSIGNTE